MVVPTYRRDLLLSESVFTNLVQVDVSAIWKRKCSNFSKSLQSSYTFRTLLLSKRFSIHLHQLLSQWRWRQHVLPKRRNKFIVCVHNYPTRCENNTVYLYLQTALHVSGVISTHHQELISLHLQYLTLLRPLLLPVVYHPVTYTTGSSIGLSNARYCRYSDMSSWWWVEVPSETCRAVFRYK